MKILRVLERRTCCKRAFAVTVVYRGNYDNEMFIALKELLTSILSIPETVPE